ncbi:MAG: hypothetical protein KAT17_03475 [Candidatus Aminicenantes bacterium]|nr:hypothetical protein [Candidatus Aminicenantes bacterium]
MSSKLIYILVFILITNSFLAGEADSDPLKKGLPVIKFIPGLVQMTSGKIIKGGVLLGACLTTIVGAIIENNRGYDYYEQYLESSDVDEVVALREKSEKSFRMRNYFIIGMVSVWVIHALDLKIFKKKKGGLKSEIKNDCIYIGLYYCF